MEDNKNNTKTKSSKISIVIMVILVLLVYMGVHACSGSGTTGSAKTNVCQSCGRSFSAGDSGGNFKNISRTGMCKNCYNNYKYATGQ